MFELGYGLFETFQTEKTLAQDTAPKDDFAYAEGIKEQFIQDYGMAYQSFGLPKLMGQIVGVLLYHKDPVSLTQITDELRVSKGPVSQIMRRLREHNLVERVWVPGNRMDFYRALPDIFGQAFGNHAKLLMSNLTLARRFKGLINQSEEEIPEKFKDNVQEMEQFYAMMQKHLDAFLEEWNETRA